MRRLAVIGLALMVLAITWVGARDTGPIGANGQTGTPETRWQADRAGMLKQVVDRAKAHVRNVHAMVEIGTMAPVDVRESERGLSDLEKLVDADAKRPSPLATPARAGIAALRIRFAEALNELDLAEVKFATGMITTASMNASLMAAATVLLGPVPPGVP